MMPSSKDTNSPAPVGSATRHVGPGRAGAWLVHAYTASGAITAFLATIALFEARYRACFLWLVLATVIDASDGWGARRARVREVLPDVDGGRLDDIVDYLTFVFVPVLLLYHAALLPSGWDWAVASVVLLSSAYGFTAADAKTDDEFFTGFPSYWNIVALYLFVAGLPPAVNAAIVLALSGMIFVRIGYVYPSKTRVLQGLTIGLGVAWAVALVVVVLGLPERRTGLLAASLVYPVYYTVLSLVLHRRRRHAPAVR
jgi:phosphatidylcholine synthase